MTGRFASRRLVAALIALTASAVLAGCASVPSSLQAQVPTAGPIEQGEQVGVQGEDQFIRVIAREPRPGMTPQEVVQGFLDASASFDGDHAVAREYLTPQASADWDTDAGVSVYEGAANLTELGSAVVMAAAQAGTIARNGRYEVKGPAAEFRTTFFVEEVAGEWRISNLPEGLLLSQSDVDRAFRSFAVFYFNPSFSMLVPDPRMIPVVGPGLATTLIRRLVAGPTPWLQPAVRTGFPAGVGLNIDAVPIEAGIARVDLTANAREADDETRQALSQQIVWTLRQLPEVQAVEITAAGQPLIVPGVPSPQPRDSWPAVDPNGMPINATGYATRPEGVVRLVGDTVESVPGGAGVGDVTLIDVAVANDSQSLAGLDLEGAVWQAPMTAGAPMIRIREPAEPTSLAFDGSSVWVVDAKDGLLALSGDGGADPIAVSGLGKRAELLAAFPSRDGTRAALIIRRGPRTGILLARVIRETGSSARITIDAPVRIESRLVEVVDAAWSGSDTITVLGSESAGTLQAFDVDIARGTNSSLGSPEAPVSVGAAPGLPTLVGAADGLVYEATTGLWTGRVRGAAPTYPG
jgi:Lipoprotein LpqB beta-propeller domain/Sporulation and spore germination